MTIASAFRTSAFCLLPFALISASRPASPPPSLEFRVVFATHQHLASQLDEAGRDGYSCLLVARNEGSPGAPGVVVWLARESGGAPRPSEYRVFTGAADLQAPLDRAGGDGFRLCGLVLSEAPPVTTVVAVMGRQAGSGAVWHYKTEALLNYKESLVRLNAAGRDGFVPMAAEAFNNNRVPAMRTWMVVAEQGEAAAAAAREIAVNSDTGPSGLQRKLNERAQEGFQVDLLWKEGNDYVAMSSRAMAGPPAPRAYAVSTNPLASAHFLSKLYLADFPYLQDRLIVTDSSVSAATDVVDDALPVLGAFPDRAALGTLASHIARNHDFVPAAARVSRGPNGQWRLTTIVVRR